MTEIYNELRAEGHDFPTFVPTPKKAVVSDRDREEEELQLALALSLSSQQEQKRPPSPTRTQPKYLFQVRALYDFNPTDSGELQLQKGEIVNVYDSTTYPDWWKGSVGNTVGIFPANYVERLDSAVNSVGVEDQPLDEIRVILNQLKTVRKLKEDISNADPLGNNYAENERLQVSLFLNRYNIKTLLN
jgi:signal transducing adaptor molecule